MSARELQLSALPAAVARAHRNAMSDAIRLRAVWLEDGGKIRPERACNAAIQISIKYGVRLDSSFHTFASQGLIAAEAIRAVQAVPMCMGVVSAARYAMVDRVERAGKRPDDGAVPTGAYVEALHKFAAAICQTDGSVGEVTAAADAAKAAARRLSYADYQVVTTAADLAISSAKTWNAQDWAQEDASCTPGSPGCLPAAYEVAAMPKRLKKALVVVGADAIGCVTGAVAASPPGAAAEAAAGPPGWAALGFQCAVWGVGTSAATGLGFLAN